MLMINNINHYRHICREHFKVFILHVLGTRHQIVYPPSCLEKGTKYTLRLDFSTYIIGQRNPQATLLIDSVKILITPEITTTFIAQYCKFSQSRDLPDFGLVLSVIQLHFNK